MRSTPSPTLRELAAALFRRPRLIAVSFAGVFLATMLYAFATPRYEANLKILLRRGRSDPVVSPRPASLADYTRSEISEEELNSEVELLRDQDLLKQVVLETGLVPVSATEPERSVESARAVRRLARDLAAEPLRKSNLIHVSYRAADPERAARVLSILSAVYVRWHTNLHRPSGELRFFEQQTAEYKRRLNRSEAELVNFTRMRGVSAPALERDIAVQKLGEAEAALRQIEQDSTDVERRTSALREQLKSFPARSVTTKRWADNPQLLEKLKTQLLELQLKRADLLTRFLPSYRLVQEVDRQIDETKQSIAAEALAPVRDETSDKDPNYEWAHMELEKAQVQQAALHARQAAASSQVEVLRRNAERMQVDSVAQQDLLREAKADEDNYLLYLRKQEEARIGDALDQQHILNVAIVDPPLAPVLPIHSVLFYFLISFGLSSAFTVVMVFAFEYFDPTIRTPDEAHGVLGIPVLAWLPEAPAERSPSKVLRSRRWKVVSP